MKVIDIVDLLGAKIEVEGESLQMEVQAVFGSDLMSDVMAFVKDNVLLLTGLANLQVIRTAEMMDIKAIVLVRGKKLDKMMSELARDKGITILSTKESMFISCGKLYEAGVTGRCVRI